MSKKIEIKIGNEVFTGELNDTKTAEEIYKALPLSGKGKTWGDEIYFSTPVDMKNENPQKEVEVGDIAYWPSGNGFCIMFGPTPASNRDKPALSSPGTVIGKIEADPKDLRNLDRYKIEVSKIGGE